MKSALLIAAIDRRLGGVLLFGDRGTGKSTAVRALARLLPVADVWAACPYGCPLQAPCEHITAAERRQRRSSKVSAPVVDMPLGVTEDRVTGSLDIEKALVHGEKAFEPGLLARANRGFLYIDEVNLLEDHIVDLLLDVAASGENVVEREGLSVRHPAEFVLIGSGNPEEGELRPQLLDRFGLAVDVATSEDIDERVEILRRRDEFENDKAGFAKRWAAQEGRWRKRIAAATERLPAVAVHDDVLRAAALLCSHLGCDGSRGELTLLRAARALAALEEADAVEIVHLRRVAAMALQHRLRRDPLDESSAGARVQRAVDEVYAG